MVVEGKTALVTGAASGIGAALVQELSKRGAKVYAADIDEHAAKAIAETCGESVYPISFDQASISSIDEMAARLWNSSGGIDLIFANAGVAVNAPLLESSPEAFEWQFSVNVRGVWALARAFLPRLIESDRPGHMTITASEHALGLQNLGAGIYTSTKHAVLGLAELLRAETPDSIGISVLCPGLVATRLNRPARFGVVPAAPSGMEALGDAIMARGMPPETVARLAVDGTERGDFYIVTHATSFAGAKSRFEEIENAFRVQAPMTDDALQYDVNTVVAAVLKDWPSSGAS